MNAKDTTFTTIEMELLWKEAKRAYEDYQQKKSDHIEGKIKNFIIVEDPGTLEEFTESRMEAFATVSQGDVVLIEGKELKRIKGNYKKDKPFKAKD